MYKIKRGLVAVDVWGCGQRRPRVDLCGSDQLTHETAISPKYGLVLFHRRADFLYTIEMGLGVLTYWGCGQRGPLVDLCGSGQVKYEAVASPKYVAAAAEY